MKTFKDKLVSFTGSIYGWGMFACLFVGGAMFLGFLVAFIIGGETATVICDIIYNVVFEKLIYAGNIIVLLGLLNMYLRKEMALTMSDHDH